MSRAVRAAVAVLVVAVAAACSGGSGDQAAPSSTTTTTTAPTTTEPTTTTLSQEEQVKQAYLAYWQMADRLGKTPDPQDPELPQRAVDPLLSSIRDGLNTQAAQGRTFVTVDGRPNQHRVDQVQVMGGAAKVNDCFVDGRSEL
ncbi:MAG TPA: hypothetical protein VHI95_18615, partial [Acidimicrobiales bacterium]|nr:hypothetical protein [Acidimicrobiales bacterium]